MAMPSGSRIAVKAEAGTVPARRRRPQLESEDEADPSQPSQATKRRRSETLEQTRQTHGQNDDDDDAAPRPTALLRDDTG